MATLDDLVVAYRKAKVDLYYSTEPRYFDLVEYEEDLAGRLTDLLARTNGPSTAWVTDPAFVGTFTFAPKSVDKLEAGPVLHSDPVEEWRSRAEGKEPSAAFRLMSRCSINFHVFSTYWLLTVGDKLDRSLGRTAYGNRLRRTRDGSLNRLAPGTFAHYLSPYRRWRDDGLDIMRAQLDAGHSIVAMTADATSFYHRLDPSFLLDERFLDRIGVSLTDDEWHTHELFTKGLRAWSQSVASETGWRGRGLPVGLPASGVVANLALAELDRIAADEFKPLYYGRYVDDIMIVLAHDQSLTNQQDLWSWLASRSNGMVELETFDDDHGGARFRARFSPPYLEGSDVVFENSKNKVFHLSGDTGRFVLGSIERTINEQASEWRAIPSVTSDPGRIGTDLAAITTANGDAAATLRDSDHVSARRAAFAIRLRDFEAYERILHPESWADHRRAFFAAVQRQLFVLPTFFDLAGYVPRLIKLAAACQDRAALAALFQALGDLYIEVRRTCVITVAEYDPHGVSAQDVASQWADQVVLECAESLAAAYTGGLTARDLREVVAPLTAIAPAAAATLRVRALRSWNQRLFMRDLAHVPYRFALMRPDLARPRNLPSAIPGPSSRLDLPLDQSLSLGLRELVDWLDDSVKDARRIPPGDQVPALVFSTRPFNVLELYLALRGDVADNLGAVPGRVIKQVLRAIRGHELTVLPEVTADGDKVTVAVPAEVKPGKRRIALGMVHTADSSMEGAAFGRHDLNRRRYEQFVDVVSEAMGRPTPVHYLLLPELAMPPMWFVHFGLRLADRGISLVSGVEYRHGLPGVVHNQVWAALRVDGAGFPFFPVYRQDKQNPAPGEERYLRELAKLVMVPEILWPQPPVIAHGDFRFALLICSEMTNIAHRTSLRGRVDALFVPEWNRDLHTFGALVESAALDIHAYIAQANHRNYGDSRIRAPRSKDWERDVVRIHGGIHDYVVVGELDYEALRRHQTKHIVIDGEFKPVPDGFEMAPERMIPTPADKERPR